jgi:hypothetical protein
MKQLKKFEKNVSISTVNSFLAKHNNCNIISHDPFLIEYEVKEDYDIPIMELKGPPIDIELIMVKDSTVEYNSDYDSRKIKFRTGNILILNGSMIFMTDQGSYELDTVDGYLYAPHTITIDDEELVCYDFNIKGIYESLHIIADYRYNEKESSMKNIIDAFNTIDIIPIDIVHLYHRRTNSTILADAIKDGAKTINNGLSQIALSNIISAEIQAHAKLKSTNAILDNRIVRT